MAFLSTVCYHHCTAQTLKSQIAFGCSATTRVYMLTEGRVEIYLSQLFLNHPKPNKASILYTHVLHGNTSMANSSAAPTPRNPPAGGHKLAPPLGCWYIDQPPL
jgi:hypothetical protein